MLLSFFGGFLFCLAALIVVPTACFLVASFFEGFPRMRLGQVAGMVALSAFVLAVLSVGPAGEGPVIALAVAVPLVIFFGVWRREFRALMLRRGDEFPDPTDKLVWVVLLTVAAPAGAWLFRSYRKARWPEPVGAGRWEAGRSGPWDEEDAPSPEPAGVE